MNRPTHLRAGYGIEHNSDTLPNGKKPDYQINGEYFDNIAPTTSNPRNIADRIKEKVELGQVNRIVLNLDDSAVDLNALRQQLNNWPIEGLKEVLVVKDGQVVPFWAPPGS